MLLDKMGYRELGEYAFPQPCRCLNLPLLRNDSDRISVTQVDHNPFYVMLRTYRVSPSILSLHHSTSLSHHLFPLHHLSSPYHPPILHPHLIPQRHPNTPRSCHHAKFRRKIRFFEVLVESWGPVPIVSKVPAAPSVSRAEHISPGNTSSSNIASCLCKSSNAHSKSIGTSTSKNSPSIRQIPSIPGRVYRKCHDQYRKPGYLGWRASYISICKQPSILLRS